MPIDPLPVSFNQIGSDAMRTKINEIIAEGVGGAVSFGTTPPAGPSDGDLWFDESTGAMYAYSSVLSGWIQTNAAGAGGSGGGGGAGEMNDLSDVQTAGSGHEPADGNVLVWNSSMSHWMPGQISAGGGATYDSGWVSATGNSTSTFNHNLGGNDIQVQVYHATSSSGANSTIAGDILDASGNIYGAMVKAITSTSLQVTTGYSVSTLQWGAGTTWSGNYIRVIATRGGGPRAYAAFNGESSNLTGSIVNSFNVSSITDNGTGNYTINFTNPVPNPIVAITYSVRAFAPYHPVYWGILSKTNSSVRIGIGTNNVYYDHPYVTFIAH